MKRRCKDPAKTKHYTDRGITVCERWLKFENFLADMGECPGPIYTLERKENSKGYELSNCVWATRKAQARNRTSNRLLTYKGKTQPITAWAEELGVTYQFLARRLRTGRGVESAFDGPRRKDAKRVKDVPKERLS